MDKQYRRWAAGVLAAVLAVLALCAAVVYAVDPCLYYRMPERWPPVFFNERYQTAGMVKHIPADTVLIGTSVTANTRASAVASVFGGTASRITIPDGDFCEFDQVMDLLFREHPPERVLFSIDLNILIRDGGESSGAMPDYLYNRNPLDDLKYLLNKDTLYYSAYTLLAGAQGNGQSIDDAFVWTDGFVWNRYVALWMYERPEAAGEALPADAYLDAVDKNLAVMDRWFREHPDTEFDVSFTPYSILAWDKAVRQGDLDARLTALAQAWESLTAYENVRLHGLIFDRETITDLDNYCDYVHYSGEVGARLLEETAAGTFLLTGEGIEETLSAWREFVVNYDYDSFWDERFWTSWNQYHDGLPDWWEALPPPPGEEA